MPDFYVGATVYIFDPNQREYDSQRRLIRRSQYIEHKISGETSQSWLVNEDGREHKFKKVDPQGLYTAQMVEDEVYIHEHRASIVRRLDCCQDARILRQVAQLLGYKDEAV